MILGILVNTKRHFVSRTLFQTILKDRNETETGTRLKQEFDESASTLYGTAKSPECVVGVGKGRRLGGVFGVRQRKPGVTGTDVPYGRYLSSNRTGRSWAVTSTPVGVPVELRRSPPTRVCCSPGRFFLRPCTHNRPVVVKHNIYRGVYVFSYL